MQTTFRDGFKAYLGPDDICGATDKRSALCAAKVHETRSGERCYVMRLNAGCGGWIVTKRMPLMGEWYDADGIRHG